MSQSLFGSALFASGLFGFVLFFFFRWVFIEKYSPEQSRNYAIITAFICAVITYGTLW